MLILPLYLSLQVSVQVYDNDRVPDPDDGWEFLPIGDKTLSIKTSSLEEKSIACNMLYWFADELKEGFFPYVKPVADILVPCLTFFYHDGMTLYSFSSLVDVFIFLIVTSSKSRCAECCRQCHALPSPLHHRALKSTKPRMYIFLFSFLNEFLKRFPRGILPSNSGKVLMVSHSG